MVMRKETARILSGEGADLLVIGCGIFIGYFVIPAEDLGWYPTILAVVLVQDFIGFLLAASGRDRKSTRLNSSH